MFYVKSIVAGSAAMTGGNLNGMGVEGVVALVVVVVVEKEGELVAVAVEAISLMYEMGSFSNTRDNAFSYPFNPLPKLSIKASINSIT